MDTVSPSVGGDGEATTPDNIQDDMTPTSNPHGCNIGEDDSGGKSSEATRNSSKPLNQQQEQVLHLGDSPGEVCSAAAVVSSAAVSEDGTNTKRIITAKASHCSNEDIEKREDTENKAEGDKSSVAKSLGNVKMESDHNEKSNDGATDVPSECSTLDERSKEVSASPVTVQGSSCYHMPSLFTPIKALDDDKRSNVTAVVSMANLSSPSSSSSHSPSESSTIAATTPTTATIPITTITTSITTTPMPTESTFVSGECEKSVMEGRSELDIRKSSTGQQNSPCMPSQPPPHPLSPKSPMKLSELCKAKHKKGRKSSETKCGSGKEMVRPMCVDSGCDGSVQHSDTTTTTTEPVSSLTTKSLQPFTPLPAEKTSDVMKRLASEEGKRILDDYIERGCDEVGDGDGKESDSSSSSPGMVMKAAEVTCTSSGTVLKQAFTTACSMGHVASVYSRPSQQQQNSGTSSCTQGGTSGITLVTSVYHSPIFSSRVDRSGGNSPQSSPGAVTPHKTPTPLRRISPAKSPMKTSPLKQVSPILRKYRKYSPKKRPQLKTKLSPILPKVSVSEVLYGLTWDQRR